MALHIYRNAKGERVPGVTTVISGNLGWNKQALMYWANQQGLDGKHHREVSQTAADIGTIAHAMVEADLKGKEWRDLVDLQGVTAVMIGKAEKAYSAWQEWKSLVNFQLLKSEESLVSEKYNYGGTIDVAMIKNSVCITDLKTSKAVYPDHKIQLAAYGKLWNANFPRKKVQSYYLLQLGKEDGSFAYHNWPELNNAWKAFLSLKRLHNLKKTV